MVTGVPQGSILGPFLFTLFINDLPYVLNKSHVMLYADDITVYFANQCTQTVEQVLTEELGLLASWIVQNGLRMNLAKTQFLTLSRRCREEEASGIKVSVNGTPLVMSDTVKYLGVTIDKRLSWKYHIESVCSKCSSALGLLKKVMSSLPTSLRKQLYQTLVQPHLDYCSVVWAECSLQDAKKLDSIQRRGMRLILNESYECSSSSMRERLGWMPPSDRRSMRRLLCIRRSLTGGCPRYLKKILLTNEEFGCRRTQGSDQLHLPYPKSNWLGKSFIYTGGRDWNQLPQYIRDASRVTSDFTFKRMVKQLFMNRSLT